MRLYLLVLYLPPVSTHNFPSIESWALPQSCFGNTAGNESFSFCIVAVLADDCFHNGGYTFAGQRRELAKCTVPPVIDGVLGEAEWQCALKLDLNYQVMPGANAAQSERTEVFVGYVARQLYFLFHAFDREP